MSRSLLIHVDELLSALDEVQSCADCRGGLGVHVEGTEWDVVIMHTHPCRAVPRAALALVPSASTGEEVPA